VGTAGVLAGLCLLAIPLRKLTSAEPVPQVRAATPVVSSKEIAAVLRLRLLAPAKRLTLKTAEGNILLDAQQPAAGESEHDAVIPFEDNRLELTLQADFGGDAKETAVFLTVMPDGFEDQTRFAIGTGTLDESLSFEWNVH
jgi:hypothetical protein